MDDAIKKGKQKAAESIYEKFDRELVSLKDLSNRLTEVSNGMITNHEPLDDPPGDPIKQDENFIGRLMNRMDQFHNLNKCLEGQIKNLETIV